MSSAIIANADAVLRATEFCQLSFQFAHFRPEDELAVLQNRVQAAPQVGGDADLLGFQV
jgi:hypothetical protein